MTTRSLPGSIACDYESSDSRTPLLGFEKKARSSAGRPNNREEENPAARFHRRSEPINRNQMKPGKRGIFFRKSFQMWE